MPASSPDDLLAFVCCTTHSLYWSRAAALSASFIVAKRTSDAGCDSVAQLASKRITLMPNKAAIARAIVATEEVDR